MPYSDDVSFGRTIVLATVGMHTVSIRATDLAGNVAGDGIWLQLGDGRVRFLLNRRDGNVTVLRPGHDETRIALADAAKADLGKMAREAIDALVAAWRELPLEAKRQSAPPPDFEEEQTKG